MNYVKSGYEEGFKDLISVLNKFIELGVPGNDCAVYHKGELVLRHMAGYSSLENKTPINGKEMYNVYSCSKPLTCTAALQLWERGAFDLDEPLYRYMPEFKEMTVQTDGGIEKAENHITIRQLFTMSAGFDYDVQRESIKRVYMQTDGKCPTRKTIEALANEPLIFEPGTSWQYSLCHDVLAAFVEVVSGKKFGDYVRDNIFNPLGMTRSTFSCSEERFAELADQYILDDNTKEHFNCGKHIRNYKLGSEYESGGAGCVTCLDDYVKFLEALRIGDIILKSETIDMMSTNQIDGDVLRAYQDQPIRVKYGYGLGVRAPYTDDALQDFGWGGAAGSYLAVDRKNDFTLFYAQHLFGSPVPDIEQKWSLGSYARKGIMK
ncbi:MAG: beta-lactamase family protein [Clostridia bacterium]|nr:beta-lactamase family protein [Clostridia bacterium]